MIGNVDQLVNQKILLWEEERRIAARKRPQGQGPMVCVSREYGARGAAMARMVAERLGFQFYSQELIQEIAEVAQVRQQVVASLDERLQDSISEWVVGLMKRDGFTPSDYLRNLSKVVLTLARLGRGVVVGRGAHFILERKSTLRVRVVSPIETRVARIAQRDSLSVDQARTTIRRIDAERVAFNRRHYGADLTDPVNYDLIVNTGTLGLEGAANQVVAAFESRFGRPA
jgi:cytidylate kinase